MTVPNLVRFAALGPSLHSFERLPPGVTYENVPLRAVDGGESQGVLYTAGPSKTVVCFMHPRGDQSRHWAMPALLEAGVSVWGQAGRYLYNDSDFVYERILADIAAACEWLRGRGFEHIVAVGNSGGGTLYSLYQSQSVTAPPQRLTDTAAGDPCDLNGWSMPPLDGLVHIATHLGQGQLMLQNIDPSVVDENDPVSCDPSLDMYEPANGFRVPPAPSHYTAEFLERYRRAQRERVGRIDAIAWQLLSAQRAALREMDEPGFARLSARVRQQVERRAVCNRYLQVHRTQANPALLDPAITPNARAIGSFYSERPDLCNYMPAGFGKWQTPRAWLSTWSANHSRGDTLACLPKVTVPTLVIAFERDNMIFPGELERLYEASPALDKQLDYVDGDHFGNLPEGATRGGRREASRRVVQWVRERFRCD